MKPEAQSGALLWLQRNHQHGKRGTANCSSGQPGTANCSTGWEDWQDKSLSLTLRFVAGGRRCRERVSRVLVILPILPILPSCRQFAVPLLLILPLSLLWVSLLSSAAHVLSSLGTMTRESYFTSRVHPGQP